MSRILRRQQISAEIERQILTGFITSDSFCKAIIPVFHTKYLQIDFIKKVAGWAIDYFEKYQKAPNKHIQTIYNKKKQKLKSIEQETIEAFLLDLSQEYEIKNFNTQYIIDETEKYLKQRFYIYFFEKIQTLITAGKLDKVQKLLDNPPKSPTLLFNVNEFEQASIDSKDFLKMDIAKPFMWISPWLTENSISMIYAEKGVGKTLLQLSLATLLTRDGSVGITIGPWEVRHQAGTLIIDGEMGISELQKRLVIFEEMYGPSSDKYPLRLLSALYYDRKTGNRINISDSEWQIKIYNYLNQHEEYQLLILDNISSLAPGLDENNKSDWDPINQWLLSIKALGITVIIIHHAGKGGQDRGTSGRTDNVDNIIKLSKVNNAGGGAKFKVNFEKSRCLDKEPIPFILKLEESEDNQYEWVMLHQARPYKNK